MLFYCALLLKKQRVLYFWFSCLSVSPLLFHKVALPAMKLMPPHSVGRVRNVHTVAVCKMLPPQEQKIY